MTVTLVVLCIFFISTLAVLLPPTVISENVKYCLLAVITALLFFSGSMHLTGIAIIILLGVLMFTAAAQQYPRWLRVVSGIASIFGILTVSGKSYGFINVTLVENIFLSKATLPFTFKLAYAKGLIGCMIVILWIRSQESLFDIKSKMVKSLIPSIVIIVLFLSLASILGYDFDPKWYWFSPYFIISNLCLNVIAEEAFFRGVIQHNLTEKLNKHTKFAGIISIVVVSVIFGLLHLRGGPTYALLASIAGLIYGGIYFYYKSLHSAILCHILLNGLYFTFLTYPG